MPGRQHADPRCLHGQHLEQRRIALVEQDGGAGGALELHCAAHVVNVRVRHYDLLHRKAVPLHEREHLLDVVTRVNDHRFARLLVTDDGAVALQRADGDNFVNHGLVESG